MSTKIQLGNNERKFTTSPAPKPTLGHASGIDLRTSHHTNMIQHVRTEATSLIPDDILHLQRMLGNQSVSRLLLGRMQRQHATGHASGSDNIQRHRAEARAYNVANALNLNIPNVGPAAFNNVQNYINNTSNPEPHRIGLRNAWNAPDALGVMQNQQIALPPELNKPIGAAAQQIARLGFFNAWLNNNVQSTEHNIAQGFAVAGGVPPAANLVDILTQNNIAAIGHDGGGFGFGLQGLIAGFAPPPLYLSAWLWNRGMSWTQALNEVFITEVINNAAITDVHLASPHFTGILNGAAPNLAAQRQAMQHAGNSQVAREIRRLLNAGALSFTWNGATLHR